MYGSFLFENEHPNKKTHFNKPLFLGRILGIYEKCIYL